MKPSDRLKELFIQDKKENPQNNSIASSLNALVNYLDEEYERNKPCEHEETEAHGFYKVCKKCNCLVGQFIKSNN